MDKIKVLMFVDRFGYGGGIQSLLYNLHTHFDPDKIHVDYLTLDDGVDRYNEQKRIRDLDSTIFILKGIWPNKITTFFKYAKKADEFFREHHDYDVVHVHASSKNYFILKYAKKYGIKVRIMHSHSSNYMSKSKFKQFVGDLLKIPTRKYSTDYFACSDLAAQWIFGKEAFKKGDVTILKNGIDLDNYKFNEIYREEIREELNIGKEEFVIGSVARFVKVKNQAFIIDIAKELVELNQNVKVILAGEGELIDECKEKVKTLNIQNNVLFLGLRSDINKLVQAIDLFIMPSLYEGLPVSAVEAQASGCVCLFSDQVSREAKLIDSTTFLSLDVSSKMWAKKIIELANQKIDRLEAHVALKNDGWNIDDIAKYLVDYYANRIGG